MDAKSTIHFMEMLSKSTEASMQKTKQNTNVESTYDVLAYLVPSFRTFVMRVPASPTSKQVY